jgi:uncharacterized protein YukE
MAVNAMTVETVQKTSAKADETATFITQRANDVRGERDNLIPKDWGGPAANAFSKTTDALLDEFAQIVKTIQEFKQRLDTTIDQNVNEVTEQESTFGSFANRLGV